MIAVDINGAPHEKIFETMSALIEHAQAFALERDDNVEFTLSVEFNELRGWGVVLRWFFEGDTSVDPGLALDGFANRDDAQRYLTEFEAQQSRRATKLS
jgi:hypothetical protein